MKINFKGTYGFLIKSFDDVRGIIPDWVQNTPWESVRSMLDYENTDIQLLSEQLTDEFTPTDLFSACNFHSLQLVQSLPGFRKKLNSIFVCIPKRIPNL
jgi:hypothetical protein